MFLKLSPDSYWIEGEKLLAENNINTTGFSIF